MGKEETVNANDLFALNSVRVSPPTIMWITANANDKHSSICTHCSSMCCNTWQRKPLTDPNGIMKKDEIKNVRNHKSGFSQIVWPSSHTHGEMLVPMEFHWHYCEHNCTLTSRHSTSMQITRYKESSLPWTPAAAVWSSPPLCRLCPVRSAPPRPFPAGLAARQPVCRSPEPSPPRPRSGPTGPGHAHSAGKIENSGVSDQIKLMSFSDSV